MLDEPERSASCQVYLEGGVPVEAGHRSDYSTCQDYGGRGEPLRLRSSSMITPSQDPYLNPIYKPPLATYGFGGLGGARLQGASFFRPHFHNKLFALNTYSMVSV
jgi:hypothetical protein